MKIDSGIGYIFNKYEIIYISRAMGAKFLFGESLRTNLSSAEIVKRAEDGLIEKDYVFKDFSGNLILNKEITEYFRPIVSPEKVINCKKNISDFENELIFYMKNNVCISIESDSSNKENYILTYISDNKKIYDDMVSFSKVNKSEFKCANDKLIIPQKQYKLMKNMLDENDEPGFELMLSDYDIREELFEEIKAVFLNKADTLIFSLCSDYKIGATDYLVYYLTDDYIWLAAPNVYDNESIRIASVTVDDITNKISAVLNDKFGIKAGNLQNLFG